MNNIKHFKEKIDRFLDEYSRLYIFSGAIRVTYKDEIIYERFLGYADIEHKVPINKNSLFNLYSVSKPFCAIGLLKLVDKGLVDLNEHPGKYVPEARDFDKSLTIKHLLQHSSGVPDFTHHKDFVNKHLSDEITDMRKMVKELTEYPANFAPGTNTLYENINFTLPALIIENITGLSYREYMQKEVFEPLGMKTARVDRPGLLVDNRVRGYDIDGDHLISQDRHVIWMLGAGDLLGTLDDVYCLNKAIKHKLLLKPETWEQVLTPSETSIFGLGCKITNWHGKKRILHNGGHKGFRTWHVQLPEDDLDIIILSNCGFGNTRVALSDVIYNAFYGHTENADKETELDTGFVMEIAQNNDVVSDDFLPKKPTPSKLSTEDEKMYLGNYEGLSLIKTEDDYCIINPDGRKLCCYWAENGLFANKYIDECYSINITDNGNITLLGKNKLNQ